MHKSQGKQKVSGILLGRATCMGLHAGHEHGRLALWLPTKDLTYHYS
jgi:hypothetical protein